MITRDEIRSIPELHKSIRIKKTQLAFLREKATSVPAGVSDRERVQTSPSTNVNKYIEEAADLHRVILENEKELLELQSRAREFISTIEDPLSKKILELRYLKCYLWEEVAELVGYDLRWIQRKEQRAVDDLTVVGHADMLI